MRVELYCKNPAEMARNSKNIPQTRQSDKARIFDVFLFLFSWIE